MNQSLLFYVICIIFVIFVFHRVQLLRLRRSVLGTQNEFVRSDEFSIRWDEGLKYREESGCYALFFYDKKINPESVAQRKRFKTLYIGQSKDIYHRVHEHLTGGGNDAAIRLILRGTPAYAVFLPCGLWRTNEYEKSLIKAFRANRKGLNIQSGGGAPR